MSRINRNSDIADHSDAMSRQTKVVEDTSLYDSGRTDSGFLSGANILSGEITQPPEPRHQDPDEEEMMKKQTEAEMAASLMRLDSGVDVGLSDQLSELAIEEQPPSDDTKIGNTTSCDLYFQQDEEGDTQLHIAIIQGFIEVVYSLIRMVPHPRYLDICNDMRQTGCHLAVLTSQPRILRRLVCVGARTDVVDRNGNTPLHLATIAGDLACVRALTDPIADAEVIAAGLSYTPKQRPVRPPSELAMYNYEGLTCVHLSVMGGHIGILSHLHWLGADINAREWKSGRTALHLAVECGDEGLVRMLVGELKARVGARTYAGRTAYQLAASSSRHRQRGVPLHTHHTHHLLRLLLEATGDNDSDYSTTEDEDDSEDEEYQVVEQPIFREMRSNGNIVNATA